MKKTCHLVFVYADFLHFLYTIFYCREQWISEGVDFSVMNPIGGYVNIKKHLEGTHGFTRAESAAIMPLVTALTDYLMYEVVKEDIRYVEKKANVLVCMLFFLLSCGKTLLLILS